MKIDLSQAACCAKCGSSNFIQRHHKGCEKLWLRHFAHKSSQLWYQRHKARYWEFREEDIVRLCDKCHKQIHKIYYRIIGRWATKHGKMKNWTNAQADELIAALRNRCDLWLIGKTHQPSRRLPKVKASA